MAMFLKKIQIYGWVKNITDVYKDIASMVNIVYSTEGRPVLGMKVSKYSNTSMI